MVVLDRDLPRVHGDDVARGLVASGSRTRILMLTAAGSMEDRVAGLDLGADDYLGKPFEFPELVSRVRALRRRSARPVPPQLERYGIRLDTVRRSASRDGRDLDPHSGAVRVCMSKLRSKLGEPAVIRTVQGVGYAP